MISINNVEVVVKRFPDGTQNIHIDKSILSFDQNRRNIVTWNYESDEEMATLLYVTEWLGEFKDILYMPYIPNARMDRVKNDDEVFTLKYFCKFINLLEYRQVLVLDPHSDVSVALLNNATSILPDYFISKTIGKIKDDNLVIFYPDNGASKRYSGMVEKPYCYGIKNRDWRTGNILGLDVITNGIDLKDKNVLIIDDICSKGGTFYHSALKLKECGVNKIYLYITHCENTIINGELLKNNGLIEKVFTTDSIYSLDEEKVEVLEND